MSSFAVIPYGRYYIGAGDIMPFLQLGSGLGFANYKNSFDNIELPDPVIDSDYSSKIILYTPQRVCCKF